MLERAPSANPDHETQHRPILIVDDEPQVIAALTDELEEEFEILSASNPREALGIVEEEPSLAVILCDQRMPGMQGSEFLTKAQELSIATRILITGYSDLEAVVKAVNEGKIFGYVSKPWDPSGLKVTIHKAMEFYELNNHLVHEKALFHDLMNSSTDAVYFKDLKLRYLRLNRPEASFLGLRNPDDALGKPDSDFLPANLGKSHEQEERLLLSSGKPIIGRVEQLSIDGTIRWLQANKAATRDATGKVTGIVGITRDITKQKQTEQDLRLLLDVTETISGSSSQDDVLQTVMDAICVAADWTYGSAWVRDTSVQGANDGADRWSAIHAHNGGGKSEVADWPEAAKRHYEDWVGLVTAVAKDGRARWLKASDDGFPAFLKNVDYARHGIQTIVTTPVVTGGQDQTVLVFASKRHRLEERRWGDVLYSIGLQLGPVLERLRIQDALTASERRFRTLIAESAQAIIVSKDMKPLYVNREFLRLHGYDREEQALSMTSTLDFIVPEDRERLKELRKAMLASEEGRVTCEVRSLNSAGETIHLVCHSARVPWDDGWATCVHLHDISEQKKAEEHLHHAQRMETVGQLSGGIAHDFNNILTVIQGNLELMEETLEVTGDSSLLDMGRSAIRASQRGADLTRRLLAFSRRQVLEREVLDVNTIVDSVCEMLDRTVGENIKVVKIPSETLPLVKTDRSQLENALLNLAVNARDAMPNGGRIVFETTVCELTSDYTDNRSEVEPGWYVLVSVSDNGVGIPQDVLPKVMEPFFTTKSVGKGTGLGLSTIFGFLKQARGHLAIYSEENQGTTVKVYLPIEEVEALPDEQEIPVISQASDNRKTVLIVEDNEDVQSIANAMISAMGLDVVLAGSGPEALDILRQHDDIDLIFTDVVMPGGMNGVEIAREARVLRPGIQILYTSGYAEGALKNSEDKQLDAEWIAKPYSRDALIRKISFLLNGST